MQYQRYNDVTAYDYLWDLCPGFVAAYDYL